MKIETAEALLSKLGVPLKPRQVSGSWYNYQCPFAPWYHKNRVDNHPSFGVLASGNRRSHYKCFSCGSKGSLALLPARLGKLRGADYSELVAWAERAEFEESETSPVPEWDDDTGIVNESKEDNAKLLNMPSFGGVALHPYLKKRGYSPLDAVRLGLRFDENQQRVLFPVYDENLQLCGFTGRSVMSDRYIGKSSSANPKSRDYGGLQKDRLFLFNPRWKRKPGNSRIILVEGPFDYARCQQAGYRGTHAILGTAVTDHKVNYLIRLNRPVTLFLDNDAAGDAATFGNINIQTGLRENTYLSWAERLFSHVPVWIARYPKSAISDNRKDPDSLTIHEIRHAISSSWLYRGLFFLPEYRKNSDNIPF